MSEKLFKKWWIEKGQHLNISQMSKEAANRYFAYEGWWAGYFVRQDDNQALNLQNKKDNLAR